MSRSILPKKLRTGYQYRVWFCNAFDRCHVFLVSFFYQTGFGCDNAADANIFQYATLQLIL